MQCDEGEVREVLAKLMAAGLVETTIIDGQVKYRLTDAGRAKAARERLEEIETCVAVGYLEPIEAGPDGERRWLITEAGEPEFLTEEQRAKPWLEWILVWPVEPN